MTIDELINALKGTQEITDDFVLEGVNLMAQLQPDETLAMIRQLVRVGDGDVTFRLRLQQWNLRAAHHPAFCEAIANTQKWRGENNVRKAAKDVRGLVDLIIQHETVDPDQMSLTIMELPTNEAYGFVDLFQKSKERILQSAVDPSVQLPDDPARKARIALIDEAVTRLVSCTKWPLARAVHPCLEALEKSLRRNEV